MSNLTNALIIVLCVSGCLILSGFIITDIRGSDANFMSCQGTLFNNCTGINNNLQGQLPSTNLNVVDPTGVTGEEGIFASIGSWLADTTGLSIIYNIVSAPSTFLRTLGLDTKYADIIAGIWYSITLFLIISWWKGQDS